MLSEIDNILVDDQTCPIPGQHSTNLHLVIPDCFMVLQKSSLRCFIVTLILHYSRECCFVGKPGFINRH